MVLIAVAFTGIVSADYEGVGCRIDGDDPVCAPIFDPCDRIDDGCDPCGNGGCEIPCVDTPCPGAGPCVQEVCPELSNQPPCGVEESGGLCVPGCIDHPIWCVPDCASEGPGECLGDPTMGKMWTSKPRLQGLDCAGSYSTAGGEVGAGGSAGGEDRPLDVSAVAKVEADVVWWEYQCSVDGIELPAHARTHLPNVTFRALEIQIRDEADAEEDWDTEEYCQYGTEPTTEEDCDLEYNPVGGAMSEMDESGEIPAQTLPQKAEACVKRSKDVRAIEYSRFDSATSNLEDPHRSGEPISVFEAQVEGWRNYDTACDTADIEWTEVDAETEHSLLLGIGGPMPSDRSASPSIDPMNSGFVDIRSLEEPLEVQGPED